MKLKRILFFQTTFLTQSLFAPLFLILTLSSSLSFAELSDSEKRTWYNRLETACLKATEHPAFEFENSKLSQRQSFCKCVNPKLLTYAQGSTKKLRSENQMRRVLTAMEKFMLEIESYSIEHKGSRVIQADLFPQAIAGILDDTLVLMDKCDDRLHDNKISK